jgi:hypothetical protein
MLTSSLRRITDNQLGPTSLAALAMQVRGELRINGEDADTSDSNEGPAVVVRCRDLQDAEQCLKFAARQGLLISLYNGDDFSRGSAHCDHGIAVDISQLHPH